jgi:hypothetical protein
MITRIKRHSHRGRIFWAIVLLVGLGAAAAYYYLHPEKLPQWAAQTSVGRELQTTTVYKWQDGSGAWHVSDEPPPAGTDYQAEQYSRDVNVLPLPPELQR